jgi:hypothetical protein
MARAERDVMKNPEAALEVWAGLKDYAQKNRLSNWDKVVGRARRQG